MSFTGDLEHLPIIDIIQLLHQTRKTGTLCLKSHKGESQLVFKDGYIVSANHHNNNIRIGRILVEMGAISEQEIEKALREQGTGDERKPLVAILIESGLIKKESAFKGLETLIELTIVEILTWREGTFTLDITAQVVSDEYRYFPEKLHEDLILDTQNVLMDALRIYDERNRDGQLVEEDWLQDDAFTLGEPVSDGAEPEQFTLSAEDLGLHELDMLERKIPEVFSGLKEENPADMHGRVVLQALKNSTDSDREAVISYLMSIDSLPSSAGRVPSAVSGPALILFSPDELLRHSMVVSGKHDGFFMTATDDPADLEMIITQTMNKDRQPILILDTPRCVGKVPDELNVMQRELLRAYPGLTIIQLSTPGDVSFSLLSLQEGVRVVLPKPGNPEEPASGKETISFLKTCREYVRQCGARKERPAFGLFYDHFTQISNLSRAPDIAFVLLKLVGSLVERSLTLVLNGKVLVAERSIGIKGEGSPTPASAFLFNIPVDGPPSLFRNVIESGRLFYGKSEDQVLRESLFSNIGTPSNPEVLLIPLKCFGRTIAIIYGDFGKKAPTPVDTAILDAAAQFGSLVLDNAVLRSRQTPKT